LAAVGEQDISIAIDQKVAAGLVDIVALVMLRLHTAAQQFPIQLQRRGREDLKPRQPFQGERLIGLAPGVSEHRERPLMVLLITHQLGRFGKGEDRDLDATAIELGMLLAHLAEVRLARQSSQVAQKNQQEIFIELFGEIDRLAIEIQQRQFF